MNPSWKTTLDAICGRLAPSDPDSPDGFDFGDAAGELVRAVHDTVVSPLPQLAVIHVGGDDAQSFLHGQLTSDVNHLAPGAVQHAAWCTPKGRILATMLVAHVTAGYLLVVADDLVERITKRLAMFVLRAKVRIERHADRDALLGVHGADALRALQAAGLPEPTADLTAAAGDMGTVIRLATGRYLVLASHAALPAAWTSLASVAGAVGRNAWDWLELQTGIPRVGAATSEEFVPQMLGFEQIGGVSFHKGCYPGQEIVARTQYLGKVKRHLYRAGGPGALVAGTSIHSPANPDTACGTVAMSALGPDGEREALVVVQENFAAGPLHLGGLDGPLLRLLAPVAHA